MQNETETITQGNLIELFTTEMKHTNGSVLYNERGENDLHLYSLVLRTLSLPILEYIGQ